MTSDRPLTIGIEAAISGGSLSLYKNGSEAGNRCGDASFTRAEELLPDIDRMLAESGHTIQEVGLIAVSAGPGSFTGIRIGFSTALGLATGLAAEIASESALKAMAYEHPGHVKLIAAVPMGREMICSQVFDTSSGVRDIGEPISQREDNFLTAVQDGTETAYLLYGDLFNKVTQSSSLVIDFGRNVASAIIKACLVRPRPQTEPIFLSKNS